jgi:hypothetical protein
MLWVPLATACLLGAVVVVLHLMTARRQQDGTRIYRAKYVQLVSQLDSITASANHLGGHLERIADPKILDYYEGTLKILETLLSAIRKLPPFGKEPTDLNPAFFLTQDCRDRIFKAQKAFRAHLRGKSVNTQQLFGQKGPKATGCYFCSRPVVANKFSKVKVKLDGDVKEVFSCSICRRELETTKKVKVLYFMKGGAPVHWSQVGDYAPNEDYWNINKHKPVRKTRHLELVVSRHSD